MSSFFKDIREIVDPMFELSEEEIVSLVEEKFTPTNSGNTKSLLPSLEECLEHFGVNHELWSDGQRLTHSYVKIVYEFIVQQLRTSA